ncbi:MAG: hypothetical protein ABSH35_30440 [Isosphaeraceae bacterium]|jgi:hypothetical protein
MATRAKKLVTKKAVPAEKAAPAEKATSKVTKTRKASKAKKPGYNEETMQVIRDAKAGKDLLRYSTAEDMFEDFGS